MLNKNEKIVAEDENYVLDGLNEIEVDNCFINASYFTDVTSRKRYSGSWDRFGNPNPLNMIRFKIKNISSLHKGESNWPYFLNTFKNISKSVKDLSDNYYLQHVIISAPVKSGKRKMVQAWSSHDKESNKKVLHIFFTALNRKDCEEQIKEMEDSGIKPFVIFKKEKATETIKKIQSLVQQYSEEHDWVIRAHFDESDYGTNVNGVTKEVYKFLLSMPNVYIACYSATNEEVIFSKFCDSAKNYEYIPDENYCGAKWYLENNLVYTATSFFANIGSLELTVQGQNLLNDFVKQEKPFSVVRLSYNKIFSSLKSDKSFCEKLEKQFNIKLHFFDESTGFDWSKGYLDFLNYNENNTKHLFIINQTASRSTEIGFHEYLYFWHDYRGKKVAYNTRHQAYLRAAYFSRNNKFFNIKIYADIPTFELAAKKIRIQDYINLGYVISPRVSSEKTIKNKNSGSYYTNDNKEELIKKIKEELNIDIVATDSVSANSHRDIALSILKDALRTSPDRLLYVDKSNIKYQASWNKLSKDKSKGNFIGKYIYPIPEEKEAMAYTKPTSFYQIN